MNWKRNFELGVDPVVTMKGLLYQYKVLEWHAGDTRL